jgi:predicted nuclease of predicted toxin-antitoxin system
LTGSLQFLLDENVPRSLARALSARGHDAMLLPDILRGAPDRDVLGEAARSGRILVTLDTDFGTLVFLRRRRPPPAVVLIRLPPAELLPRLEAVVAAIEQHAAGTGMFVVLDGGDRLAVDTAIDQLGDHLGQIGGADAGTCQQRFGPIGAGLVEEQAQQRRSVQHVPALYAPAASGRCSSISSSETSFLPGPGA